MCAAGSTHSAVKTLDMQRYRFGLLVGGVQKELGFCFLLPLRYRQNRISRCIQDVKNLLCQGCDVNREALPENDIKVTHSPFQQKIQKPSPKTNLISLSTYDEHAGVEKRKQTYLIKFSKLTIMPSSFFMMGMFGGNSAKYRNA